MGVDDSELTEIIKKDLLSRLLDQVDAKDPRYKAIFEDYLRLKGTPGPTGEEYIQAIIEFAGVPPKAFDLQSKEGRAEFYAARVEAVRKAGLIGKEEKLAKKDYQLIKNAAKTLKEIVLAQRDTRTSNLQPSWGSSGQLQRERRKNPISDV